VADASVVADEAAEFHRLERFDVERDRRGGVAHRDVSGDRLSSGGLSGDGCVGVGHVGLQVGGDRAAEFVGELRTRIEWAVGDP
jgi:hypothetical protein